jgi:hypothetical protein
LNRREAIKAGITAVMAPVVAMGAVTGSVIELRQGESYTTKEYTPERYGRSPLMEALPEFKRMNAISRAGLKEPHKRQGNIYKQWKEQ